MRPAAGDLAPLLRGLALATAARVAGDVSNRTAVAATVTPAMRQSLEAEADISAAKITGSIRSRLAASGDYTAEQLDAIFPDAHDLAAKRLRLVSLATAEAVFSVTDAKTVKRWVVNSSNPRSSHRDMGGKTATVGEVFDNGMYGPGDIGRGGVDEVAGCTCTIDYTGPDLEKSYSLNAGIEALLLRNG